MTTSLYTLFTDGGAYLLLLLYLLALVWFESSKQGSKYKYVTLGLTTAVLTLFIGLRWETGTDWVPYKELFDTLQLNWTFLINIYHFDIGYVIFNAIIKFFTNNYSIFLLADAALAIGLLAYLLNKISFYPNLSLLLFYTNFMIAQFMGSNRRMISMVLILWSLYYIATSKRNKSILFTVFAFLFHRASIISLLAFLIPKQLISIHKTIILLLSAFVIGIAQIPARIIEFAVKHLDNLTHIPIVEAMAFYSENGEEHLATSSGSIVIATTFAVIKRGIFIFFYSYIIKHNKVDPLTIFFYNVYIISFTGYLLFVGSFFQMLTAFFAFAEIILIGRIYRYTNIFQKKILCFTIIFFCILQINNALNIYPDLYLPYKSILQFL